MAFNDFVTTELPLRPAVAVDGTQGQILVRSSNPLAARQMVWADVNSIISGSSVKINNSRTNQDIVTLWQCAPTILVPNGYAKLASSSLLASYKYDGLVQDPSITVGATGLIQAAGILTAVTTTWYNITLEPGG